LGYAHTQKRGTLRNVPANLSPNIVQNRDIQGLHAGLIRLKIDTFSGFFLQKQLQK
jgi:hypothetical protein